MTYYQNIKERSIKGEVTWSDLQDQKQAVWILFFVGFIALLTLLVQAPAGGWVMRKLGIIHVTKAESIIHEDVLTRLHLEV